MKNLKIVASIAVLSITALSVSAKAAPFNPVTGAEGSKAVAKPIYKVGKPYSIKGVTYTPRLQRDYDEVGKASWYGDKFHGQLTANGEVFDKTLLTAASTTLPLPSIVEVTNLSNGKTVIVRVNDRGPYANDGRIIDLSERAAEVLEFKNQGITKVRVRVLSQLNQQVGAQMPNYEKVLTSLNQEGVVDEDKVKETTKATLQPVNTSKTSNIPNKANTVKVAEEGSSDVHNQAGGTISSKNLHQVSLQEPDGVRQYIPRGVFVQVGAFSNQNVVADKLKKDLQELSTVGSVVLQNVDVKGKNFLRVRVGPYGSIDDASKIKDDLVKLGYQSPRVIVED